MRWTDKSLLSILACTGAYIMALALLSAEQGRMREGAEHGSAAWASPRQVNAMFAQKEPTGDDREGAVPPQTQPCGVGIPPQMEG